MSDPFAWTPSEVAAWFASQGAPPYVQQRVVEEEISGDALASLNGLLLSKLGVSSMSAQQNLLQAIQTLFTPQVPEPTGQPYYYNALPAMHANRALSGHPDGDYLVHDAPDGVSYVISYVYGGQALQATVRFDDVAQRFLIEGQYYNTFRELLDAYAAVGSLLQPMVNAHVPATIEGGPPLVFLNELIISQFSLSDDATMDPYFHGDLTLHLAVVILQTNPLPGTFIVWRGPNGYVLSFLSETVQPVHILIMHDADGTLSIKSGDNGEVTVRHANFQELVFHWWSTAVLIGFLASDVSTRQPAQPASAYGLIPQASETSLRQPPPPIPDRSGVSARHEQPPSHPTTAHVVSATGTWKKDDSGSSDDDIVYASFSQLLAGEQASTSARDEQIHYSAVPPTIIQAQAYSPGHYGTISQLMLGVTDGQSHSVAGRQSHHGSISAALEMAENDARYGSIPQLTAGAAIAQGPRATSTGFSTNPNSDSTQNEDEVFVYGAIPRTTRGIHHRAVAERKHKRSAHSGGTRHRSSSRSGLSRSDVGRRRPSSSPRVAAIEGIKHPRMAELKKRIESTAPRISGKSAGVGWPHQHPSGEEIAKAGFYFSATGSQVYNVTDLILCYACGVKLSNFKEGDDINARHKASSPDCTLLKN